jgi:hypothetical protein
MATTTIDVADEFGRARPVPGLAAGDRTAPAGAVSWGAVFAGAAAAAALSMILLLLGSGLGLSAVSPWSQAGISAVTFGVTTILWVTVTQAIASGMGGYLAGRLRVKWAAVHTDEVYFRDTAHGFLAWAIATLGTAALLGSVIGSIVGGGVQAGAAVAGGAVSGATTGAAAMLGATGAADAAGAKGGESSGPMAYLMDTLFRRDSAAAPSPSGNPDAAGAAPAAEVARIFMNSIDRGALPAEDARYLGRLVAQRTGLSEDDAQKRVLDVYGRAQAQWREAQTRAKQAADTARKAASYGALWLFVSLLIGAFCASLAATFGGRQRDA